MRAVSDEQLIEWVTGGDSSCLGTLFERSQEMLKLNVQADINGDLSIGLPANAGVQLHLDSAEGEIYADFEVDVQMSEPVVERREDRGGVELFPATNREPISAA